MTANSVSISTLKQFVQGGMLGKVTANLAAVFAELSETQIIMSTYFFEKATDADREYIELAATEIIANFPAGYTIETRYRLLSDMELASTLNCVFLRAEAEAQVLGPRSAES